MKEMIYKAELVSEDNPPELLTRGEYKSIDYYVLSMHSHPCAYVIINNTSHAVYGKSWQELDELIPCHGGITYAEPYLGNEQQFVNMKEGKWVIGWDYGHCNDFNGYFNEVNIMGNDEDVLHKYTTPEIIQDVHDVIEQIIGMEE